VIVQTETHAMPKKIELTENEKTAVRVGAAVGGAMAGAIAGAARAATRAPAPAPVTVVPVAQPMFVQQQPQVIVQQVTMQPVAQGPGMVQVVGGIAHAFGGTEYPPRDACLCCGAGCCYQSLTSRNWARCHNDMRCCCVSCETCCCTNAVIPSQCCVDHLGCKAPQFECCNCGLACCQCKIISPIHTGECCVGHSQCCLQVSAWAIPCSGVEKTGVPCLVTCGGLNCYPAVGCCLVTGDAMAKGTTTRQAPANDMVR
jgi:hypothetical protein